MNAPQAKVPAKTKAPAKKRASKSTRNKHDIKKLYELGTAFWASGALLAAIKLELFSKLENGPLAAEALAATLDLKGRKTLCDVGGGPGTYAAVLCLRNPELRATVLDDPEVVPVARELIDRFGLKDRINVKPAQILFDSYGDNHDVVLL